jgi:hypothetical protein
MAKKSERVMEMVRREFDRDPDIKSGELYEKAKKLDRSIRRLSLRQFHAVYPLQVKRLAKAAGGSRKKRAQATKAKKPGRKPAGRRTTRTAAAAAAPAAAAAASGGGRDRAAVRKALIDFATLIARADSKADMIAVMQGLENWVDRVMDAG